MMQSQSAEDAPAYTTALSKRLLKKDETAVAVPAIDPVAQQKAEYDKALADAKSSYDKQAADRQAASDSEFADAQAKIEASRTAAAEVAKNAQTYKDNSGRDLSSSEQAIIVAGGSANDATAKDAEVKRKRVGGGISSQLGINI